MIKKNSFTLLRLVVYYIVQRRKCPSPTFKGSFSWNLRSFYHLPALFTHVMVIWLINYASINLLSSTFKLQQIPKSLDYDFYEILYCFHHTSFSSTYIYKICNIIRMKIIPTQLSLMKKYAHLVYEKNCLNNRVLSSWVGF